MAKDFKIEGAALVIEEGGVVIFENPKRDLYFDNSELLQNSRVVLYDTNGTNKNASSVFSADLSECTDNGTPFTDETLRTFSRGNLGFSSASGGSEAGFIDYNDTTGSIALVADTWTDVPNNGLGAFTNKAYAPVGVTELLDTSTGYLDFTDLDLGDTIQVRIDFKVKPNINNATLECRYVLGNGGGQYALTVFEKRLDRGSGIDYDADKGSFLIYMGDDNTRLNDGKLQVKLSSDGELTNSGVAIQILT